MGMAVVVSLIVGCGVVIMTMLVAVAVAMVVTSLRALAMGSTASSVFFGSVHFGCCCGFKSVLFSFFQNFNAFSDPLLLSKTGYILCTVGQV